MEIGRAEFRGTSSPIAVNLLMGRAWVHKFRGSGAPNI